MKTRWIGLPLMVIVAIGMVFYKLDRSPKPTVEATQSVSAAVQPTQGVSPSKKEVILVADLSEANEKGDNCAEIIHLVRDAGTRGIKIQEFSPDSDSPLIKQYHVLTVPTVLVLDDGRVVSRYEGESGSTVSEIRSRLATINEAGR